MHLVEILGGGCSGCRRLEAAVREALARGDEAAEIRHITDFAEISPRGAMSLPALVIDGRVVSAGRTPTVQQIETWLRESEAVGRGR